MLNEDSSTSSTGGGSGTGSTGSAESAGGGGGAGGAFQIQVSPQDKEAIERVSKTVIKNLLANLESNYTCFVCLVEVTWIS